MATTWLWLLLLTISKQQCKVLELLALAHRLAADLMDDFQLRALTPHSDGSMAGLLLGASPGASTTVTITFGILNKCPPKVMPEWTPKILEMVPPINPNHGGPTQTDAVHGQARTAKIHGLNQCGDARLVSCSLVCLLQQLRL